MRLERRPARGPAATSASMQCLLSSRRLKVIPNSLSAKDDERSFAPPKRGIEVLGALLIALLAAVLSSTS